MAWESYVGVIQGHSNQVKKPYTLHYIYEPESYVPLVQLRYNSVLPLLERPNYEELIAEGYDIDKDPVWTHDVQQLRPALENIAYYHCDQLGTPQELTDRNAQLVWSANYKAWGEASVKQSAAGVAQDVRNQHRYQGQYYDEETGLHYNRFRYYDPHMARYVSRDPIGLQGGLNNSAYVPNSNQWIDPLGLYTIIDEGIEKKFKNGEIPDCGNGKCRLPFDYAYCSGGAFGVNGMAVVNLYDGSIYPGMGKSRISKVELENPASMKSLKSVLSGSCMLGRIFNGKGRTNKEMTDGFIRGAAVGASAGPWWKIGVSTPLDASNKNIKDQPFAIEIGVGTPGLDWSFGGVSKDWDVAPVEFLKQINRQQDAKTWEMMQKQRDRTSPQGIGQIFDTLHLSTK